MPHSHFFDIIKNVGIKTLIIIARHAVRCNGLTGLWSTSLTRCTAYEKDDGARVSEFPPAYEELGRCKPIYEDIPGFDEDITGCGSFEELPAACKNYIERLEKLCGCPVVAVGVGPAREQNLER